MSIVQREKGIDRVNGDQGRGMFCMASWVLVFETEHSALDLRVFF